MATITFNGESYTVDHAVQGADYVHGYDAEGILVVSFEGCSSFEDITYDGVYMAPEACAEESCNTTWYVSGALETAGGTVIIPAVTTADNGKFFRVVNGVGAWATVPSAEGGAY